MRSLSSSLLTIMVLASNGQDWAVINPAYRYNYSDDGTDTISNQIFVTNIDTLGVDSFRYELNTVGALCPGCSPDYTSLCWNGLTTDLVHALGTQALGHVQVRHGAISYIVGPEDTLQLEPMRAIGATWTGPGGISGSIYSADTMDVFGAVDSVKWMAYSNGDTLALSRQHGVLVVIRSGIGRYDRVGTDGQIQEGLHFPKVIDLFDYEVGDVLQYRDNSTFQSSFCVHFVEGRTRYEVIGRSDEDGYTIYSLERTFSSVEESFHPQMWMPCGTYLWEGQDQISLRVDHDRFEEENFFNSGIQGPLYPDALDSVFQDPVSNGLLTALSVRLDSVGRYLIEPSIIQSSGWEATLLCQSNEDPQLLFPNSNGNYRFSYTAGVGLTFQDYFSFESGATRSLEGYILSGEQWGSVWSSSAILDTPEMSMDRISIHPNPASSELYVNDATLGSMLAITDLQGRLVHRQRITTEDTHLSLHTLHPGSYLLTVDGLSPHRFVVAR